jgi:hypothetical protein
MKLSDAHRLDELKLQALVLMKEAGFALTGEVAVTLDPDLPYMGYTTEREGKPVIVVSGMALASGGAINLLIHEMSHVYRSQSGHPSHDYQLLTSIAAWVMKGSIVFPYQEKIIHTILNNIQDLYADDISFKIFKTSQENLSEFFMGWIHKPVPSTSTEHLWTNADYLLSAAFAEANLERHNVSDKGGKVTKAIKEFLAKTDKKQAVKYEYFKDFMVKLPEKVTEREFEKLLITYLGEFLKLTKV